MAASGTTTVDYWAMVPSSDRTPLPKSVSRGRMLDHP
jgi:hypothetical protein